MNLYIYRPKSFVARAVRKCTTCRKKRRFLVKVYGWHPSTWICGGCGWSFCGGRQNVTPTKREENKEFVRTEWKNAMNHKQAIEEIISVT